MLAEMFPLEGQLKGGGNLLQSLRLLPPPPPLLSIPSPPSVLSIFWHVSILLHSLPSGFIARQPYPYTIQLTALSQLIGHKAQPLKGKDFLGSTSRPASCMQPHPPHHEGWGQETCHNHRNFPCSISDKGCVCMYLL